MRIAAAVAPVCIVCVVSASAQGQPKKPDHYSVSSKDFGWWSGELQIRLGYPEGKRRITDLSCVLRGYDGVDLTLTRPVESNRMGAAFKFAIEGDDATGDPELIQRTVVTLGIGGRTYEFSRIQWRFSPEFLGWEPGAEIQLAYGRSMAAFRAGEDYPWLPIEYLIPALMEVETIRIGYRGQKEITHGDYESVYRERTIRMDGFNEAMRWCGTALRSERDIKLPPELRPKRGQP